MHQLLKIINADLFQAGNSKTVAECSRSARVTPMQIWPLTMQAPAEKCSPSRRASHLRFWLYLLILNSAIVLM